MPWSGRSGLYLSRAKRFDFGSTRLAFQSAIFVGQIELSPDRVEYLLCNLSGELTVYPSFKRPDHDMIRVVLEPVYHIRSQIVSILRRRR